MGLARAVLKEWSTVPTDPDSIRRCPRIPDHTIEGGSAAMKEVDEMTLVRWRPVNDLFSIQNEIDRVFESFLRTPSAAPGERAWVPAADLRETENEFILTA